MTIRRDMLGMLCILAGVPLWAIALGKDKYWWALFGGLLVTAGFGLVWKRQRERGGAADGGPLYAGSSSDGGADACGDAGSAGGCD